MFKKGILTTFALLFGLIATIGQTAEFGTEAEAKSMIERAVNLVKEDKIRALDAFTDLEGKDSRGVYLTVVLCCI